MVWPAMMPKRHKKRGDREEPLPFAHIHPLREALPQWSVRGGTREKASC